MEDDRITRQLQTVMVCQVCGRSALVGVKHWLDEPHRFVEDLRIIRCPEHWSEWALRHTEVGRTKEMRARAAIAAQQPVQTFPAHLEPIVTRDPE